MTIEKELRRVQYGQGDIRYRIITLEDRLLKDMQTPGRKPQEEEMVRADRLPILPIEWINYQMGIEE